MKPISWFRDWKKENGFNVDVVELIAIYNKAYEEAYKEAYKKGYNDGVLRDAEQDK